MDRGFFWLSLRQKRKKITFFSAAAPPLAPFAPADEEAETEPFFETAVFETVDFEAAVPAFTGSAAATSFPINFGFFVGGGGDTCKIKRRHEHENVNVYMYRADHDLRV